MNVQAADIGYSQIIEHLVNIHILMEPICVGVKRHFPSKHPLQQMLKFHCREIIVPNTFGIQTLVGEGEFTHKLFAYGHLGAQELIRRAFPLTSWDVTDFRANLKVANLWFELMVYFTCHSITKTNLFSLSHLLLQNELVLFCMMTL